MKPAQDWELWRRAPWLFQGLHSVRGVLRRAGQMARDAAIRTVWPGLTYVEDGLATDHTAHFVDEPRFQRAYSLGKATDSWGGHEIRWRANVACWAASQASQLEGDLVECGVNRGGLALTVASYLGLQTLDRRFYLLDTFAGIPAKSISAEEWALGRRPGGYDECFAQVQSVFEAYPNVQLIRGAIPDTLQQVEAEKVCYLSIDMNCVAPEIAAAEFFWPKLAHGGIILLDDYGQKAFLPQKRAFDAFAAQRGVQVLGLPTGQGLIVKP